MIRVSGMKWILKICVSFAVKYIMLNGKLSKVRLFSTLFYTFTISCVGGGA